MRIILATGNAKKRTEIESILAGLDVELLPMTELGLVGPEEDGETFEANALLKARAIVATTGDAAIADDSGLEVDVLGGAPGVRSARYAGQDATDADNNAKLMAALHGTEAAERTARFVCAAVLVVPEGDEWVVRRTMEGHLTDEPRGEHGFGYDPYFVGVGDDRTNAQLTPQEKDARSHRGSAFRALRPHVETWLQNQAGERPAQADDR